MDNETALMLFNGSHVHPKDAHILLFKLVLEELINLTKALCAKELIMSCARKLLLASIDVLSANRYEKSKLLDSLIANYRVHSEALVTLECALLAKKESQVVSSTFVREVIDEAYKNLAYASNHLQNALDELDEFNKAI